MIQRELNYDPIFNGQHHYRRLLDAMARPGKIVSLDDVSISPPLGWSAAAMLVGFTLLDREVSFWNLLLDQGLKNYLSHQTGAVYAEVELADFVFWQGHVPFSKNKSIKSGTLEYPEDSATLILQVDEVSEHAIENSLGVIMTGPGIKHDHTRFIKGLHPDNLMLIQQINAEYPLGVDLFLADRKNQVMAISRTTAFTWS